MGRRLCRSAIPIVKSIFRLTKSGAPLAYAQFGKGLSHLILDFNPAKSLYILRVPRSAALRPDALIRDYGMSYSDSASTAGEAVLFTPQPYAAATFAEFATPAALAKLDWIVREVAASRAPTSATVYPVPARLRDQGTDLWGYQRADLDYMLSRERVLDGDEPGLGKTPTAIVFANAIEAQRVLVICPANIRFQWVRVIKEWSTMGETYSAPDKMICPVTTGKGGVHPKAAWTVVSYELARTAGILNALRQSRYDLLILDECHYLKSSEARRTRAVFGGGRDILYHSALADTAKRVVALSGTFLPNRPREAFVLGRAFDHASIDWLSEERFGEIFNPIEVRDVVKRLQNGREILVRVNDERSGRHAELQNRMRAHFMTRHLKREVMTQLQYPVYDLVRMDEMTPAIRQALHAESLLGIDPEHLEHATIEVLGHVAEARRLMGEAMAPQAAAYIALLLEGGEEKIALFYWHISVGDILQKLLAKYGVCRVDGSTGARMKDTLVNEFQTDPWKRVMMGNHLSLGTGTDGLQHVCSHGVIAEPDWVPGVNVQCFDRLDRGGQKGKVLGDICVVPGSLGEKILAASLRKLHTIHSAMDRRVV